MPKRYRCLIQAHIKKKEEKKRRKKNRRGGRRRKGGRVLISNHLPCCNHSTHTRLRTRTRTRTHTHYLLSNHTQLEASAVDTNTHKRSETSYLPRPLAAPHCVPLPLDRNKREVCRTRLVTVQANQLCAFCGAVQVSPGSP